MALTNRTDIWRSNVFGTVALFDQAVKSGVRRTIALSSMSAFPGTRQLYGRAKLATELAARARGLCVVRPGLVYGAGWGGMAGTLYRLAALPVLPDFGPGAHQFTVSEDDFAAAVVALASAERLPALPVGIARPEPVLFTELLDELRRQEGKTAASVCPHPSHGGVRSHACDRALTAKTARPSGLPPGACAAGTLRAERRGPRSARPCPATVRPGRHWCLGSTAGLGLFQARLTCRIAKSTPAARLCREPAPGWGSARSSMRRSRSAVDLAQGVSIRDQQHL